MAQTILVVDDSPVLRFSIRPVLEKAGFVVEEAENGLHALERLRELEDEGRPPTLILTDINMPKMDGIELIRQLKSSEFRFIPILVLSTDSEEQQKLEGKKAGAAGWIVKPFEEESLLRVLRFFVRPGIDEGRS